MATIRRLLLRLVGLAAAAVASIGPEGETPARRVLVIKPDHLGDLLLLTPALTELRRRLPEAHISLLVGPWSAPALHGNAAVDTMLLCPFPGFTRQPKAHLLQPYGLLLKTAWLLRTGRYDVALVARDDHWWGALLALLAGIRRRIGYATPEVGPLLTEALPYVPSAHVTIQGLDLVARLTGSPSNRAPSMSAPITADDETWAQQWLTAHAVGQHEQLAAIHPGAGGLAKLWVSSRWAMVAEELAQRGWRIILTGGPEERTIVEEIAGGLSRPSLQCVGEATLGQLAALYRHCSLVLGVDSGPLHLATAAGTPTIALFGPIDHRRFGPWGPPERHQVIRSGLWCSPCRVPDACPRGTSPAECMTTIPVRSVLAAVDRFDVRSAVNVVSEASDRSHPNLLA